MAPVKAPDVIEFHGSSFLRKYINEQSMVENKPPHTAKLPPITGARDLTVDQAPVVRLENPDGALRNPFIAWKTPPPMAPMVNAPPQSSTIRHGHGSREYSSI